MTQQPTTSGQTGLLTEWHEQASIKRLLLPADLVDQAKPVVEESLVCQKTTTEYLKMTDKWEQKTLKVGETDRYSTNFQYRPDTFKDETVRLITGAQGIECSSCRGSGQTKCSPTMSCQGCYGSGEQDVRCPHCDNGRERYVETQATRFGTQTETKTRFCRRCSGSAKVKGVCARCGGTKREVCDKCLGTGVVTCKGCDGVGVVVSASICTRKFACSTEFQYQLSGLGINEFKNGLESRHFKKLAGNMLNQEFKSPADEDVVLQRESLESYDVLTSEYDYNGKAFWVDCIRSDAALKWVTPGIPLSMPRLAIASGIALCVVLALVTLVILL